MDRRILAAVAAALITALPAHAGRPLQTEDAGVIVRGDCEVEGVAARVSLAGQHGTGRSLQLGCGIGADTQLALAATRASAAGETVSGWALGGKTALWRSAGDEAPAFALAYGAAWERAAGQGLRHSMSVVSAVYSAPWPRARCMPTSASSATKRPGTPPPSGTSRTSTRASTSAASASRRWASCSARAANRPGGTSRCAQPWCPIGSSSMHRSDASSATAGRAS